MNLTTQQRKRAYRANSDTTGGKTKVSDITKSKYAKFLENVCSDIVKTKPKNIAVVFFSDDGEAHTHYFGTCYPAEVGQMAWQLNADACLTLTQANAGLILEAAEQEDEDGEPEEN